MSAYSRMRMPCPVCGANSYVRTSRALSEKVREQYLHCGNDDCQCIFKAIVEVATIIGPSLLPDDKQSEFSRTVPRAKRPAAPVPHDPRQLYLMGIPIPAS